MWITSRTTSTSWCSTTPSSASAARNSTAIKWLTTILDEGQQIKNPDSKAAKCARELDSQNRLVLTGTPIENRLLDMWSLMAFAMPGVLGSRAYFKKRFDKRKDPLSQTRLASRLRPFLLRRTKLQVAQDLPPRTEEEVYSKMEGVQLDLYKAELKRIQKALLGLDSDEAVKKNSFAILQGLMRLRQICCHPGLIDPKYLKEESAKMESLFYLLDQLHEEGHKVLVFSQFVSMLDLIKARLELEAALTTTSPARPRTARARSRNSRPPRIPRSSCSRSKPAAPAST
jgi:SNF2 family DNA or RNA helicase